MSEGRDTAAAQLDALMYRFVGRLLLLGAAVLLGLGMLLLGLPRVAQPDGTLLVLPGTAGRHTVSLIAVPVLAAAGLLLGLPGLVALGLGRRRARFAPTARQRPNRLAWRRPAFVLLGGVALLTVALLRR